MRVSNILDPIHAELEPRVWDDPASEKPVLKSTHAHWIKSQIYKTLEAAGYTDVEKWLTLVLTGSLTTYQYSANSDVDISLFVDTKIFPEWSRAEMIALMVQHLDGTTLPGTPFPLQDFVVGEGIKPSDLYKPGLRSGYNLDNSKWIVPPERDRVHDVRAEQGGFYAWALQMADKMERLLQYEPEQAIEFWHMIHKKRQRDMAAGKGDFAESNIVYKMLANRGLFPQISDVSGEYIAHTQREAMAVPLYHVAPTSARENIEQHGLRGHERSETQSPWSGEYGQPAGNYFWDDPRAAAQYIYPLHGQIQKARGEDGGDYPGDDPEFGMNHEIYDGTILEPEDEEGYEDEFKETPYDHTNPAHRALLPSYLQGYDIWHVPEGALQHVQRDPENFLIKQQEEGADWLTPEQALERSRQLEREHGEADYEGSGALRYYTPEHVPPESLSLHGHIPPWKMTQEGFYDSLDDDPPREYPESYHHVPIENWKTYKPPEHEEWVDPERFGKTAHVEYVPGQLHKGLWDEGGNLHMWPTAKGDEDWEPSHTGYAEENGLGEYTDPFVVHPNGTTNVWNDFDGWADPAHHAELQRSVPGLKVNEKWSFSKTAANDWFAPSYMVPDDVKQKIHEWAHTLPWPLGSRMQQPDRYHVTGIYSPTGWNDPTHHQWVQGHSGLTYPVQTIGVDNFTPAKLEDKVPVVLRLHHPQLEADTERLIDEAQARGLPVSRFPGGYKPHITLGHSPTPLEVDHPNLSFNVGPLRELHSYYDELKRPTIASAPKAPPHLRDMHEPTPDEKAELAKEFKVGESKCGNCSMFWKNKNGKGHCWGYGEHDVLAIEVCDSWAPDAKAKTSAGPSYRQIAKFVYDPTTNRMLLGQMGRPEGEHPTHNELFQHPSWNNWEGSDPTNAMFGELFHNGYGEVYSRPRVVQGKGTENPWKQQYRTEQALIRSVPGTKFTRPTNNSLDNPAWELEANPEITYIGEPPQIAPADQDTHWNFQAHVGIKQIAQQVYEQAVSGEGSTVNLAGEGPQTRYGFAPDLATQTPFALKTFSPADVETFIHRFGDRLRDPDKFVGAWIQGDEVILDVTEDSNDYQTAYDRAWKGHQKALWDSRVNEELPVRGLDYEQPSLDASSMA